MAMTEIFFLDAANLRDSLHDGRHLQTRYQSLCPCVFIGPRLLRDELPHLLDPLRAAEVDLTSEFFPYRLGRRELRQDEFAIHLVALRPLGMRVEQPLGVKPLRN